MFPHNLTLAAGETQNRAVSGNYVYVDQATGPIRIEAYDRGGRVAEVPLSFAREARLPFFSSLYITDLSGAQNSLRLLIGGENEAYERNGSEITGPVDGAGRVEVASDRVIRVASRLFEIQSSYQFSQISVSELVIRNHQTTIPGEPLVFENLQVHSHSGATYPNAATLTALPTAAYTWVADGNIDAYHLDSLSQNNRLLEYGSAAEAIGETPMARVELTAANPSRELARGPLVLDENLGVFAIALNGADMYLSGIVHSVSEL